MFSIADTIVAIATPLGRGGIGVIRVSGPRAHDVACSVFGQSRALIPRHATLVTVRTGGDTALADRAVVTYFPAPQSYTGDDVVEISAHGSPIVLTAIVEMAVQGGARLAEPGEYTLRAFLNGRVDLAQAEAVRDLIEAVTPAQARSAFDQLSGTLTRAIAEIEKALFELIVTLEASVDFPDEGYHFLASANVAEAIDAICGRTAALLANARRGRLIREGAQVAIVGMPNVGKSSLFNALVGTARAIVTEYPGTTRDLVSETVDLDGLRVTLVDSAGIRETSDPVEAEGVARSHGAARVADLRVLVCDRSVPEQERALEGFLAREAGGPTLVVANKADLPAAWSRNDAVEVSATTGFGLDAVRSAIVRALDVEPLRDRPEISNMRHVELVARADAALRQARQAASSDGLALSEEFVLADLQRARGALEEITGRRTTDELLAHIFSAFCIGK